MSKLETYWDVTKKDIRFTCSSVSSLYGKIDDMNHEGLKYFCNQLQMPDLDDENMKKVLRERVHHKHIQDMVQGSNRYDIIENERSAISNDSGIISANGTIIKHPESAYDESSISYEPETSDGSSNGYERVDSDGSSLSLERVASEVTYGIDNELYVNEKRMEQMSFPRNREMPILEQIKQPPPPNRPKSITNQSKPPLPAGRKEQILKKTAPPSLPPKRETYCKSSPTTFNC